MLGVAWPAGALKAALEARSYRKEVIIIFALDNRLVGLVQAWNDMKEQGFAHVLPMLPSEGACRWVGEAEGITMMVGWVLLAMMMGCVWACGEVGAGHDGGGCVGHDGGVCAGHDDGVCAGHVVRWVQAMMVGGGGCTGTCVVHVWYMCGTCMAPVWYPYGTCVVHVWYPYGTCVVHVTCVIHVWHLCGTRVVHVWYPCGTCVAPVWYGGGHQRWLQEVQLHMSYHYISVSLFCTLFLTHAPPTCPCPSPLLLLLLH